MSHNMTKVQKYDPEFGEHKCSKNITVVIKNVSIDYYWIMQFQKKLFELMII